MASSSSSSSLSEHLYQRLQTLVDPNNNNEVETKIANIEQFISGQEKIDGYVTLSGNVHRAQLSPHGLPQWNSVYRKAYNIIFWLRPRIVVDEIDDKVEEEKTSGEEQPKPEEQAGKTEKDNSQQATSPVDDVDDDDDNTKHQQLNAKRILYRFSTSGQDHNGTGVCVTCSPWKLLSNENENEENGYIQTTLTAFALPYHNPSKLQTSTTNKKGGGSSNNSFRKKKKQAPSSSYSSWTQQTLTLKIDEWNLVCCGHIYPYLKRPLWTVHVNGRNMDDGGGNNMNNNSGGGGGELHYPILNENNHSSHHHHHHRNMEYCTLLQNITAGGVTPQQQQQRGGASASSDDQKTASQLQEEATQFQQTESLDFVMDVAHVALYAQAIPHYLQALLAEAGPNHALQQHGRCVLPPVPNSTKGCSLQSGPKVGIPSTVHGSALELQQLSTTFATSIVSSRILGSTTSSSRIEIPFLPQPGQTESTPRVGLIQPDDRYLRHQHNLDYDGDDDDDENRMVLYMTGQCQWVSTLPKYQEVHGLLPSPTTTTMRTLGTTRNWSIALLEQQAITMAMLPLFLALPPPTIHHQNTSEEAILLSSNSWKFLYMCYKQNLASHLIRFLSYLIQLGGARAHEEVLQNGILHMLSTSLRLGLIRASKWKLFKLDMSMDEFVKRQMATTESYYYYQSSNTSNASPPYVPLSIAEAVVDLFHICCGGDAHSDASTTTLDQLSPHVQIRRTSDLALTALFGLALDWDLWGQDIVAASVVWKAVATKYGGVCITTGYVLRSQISVQHFLDRIRLVKALETSTQDQNNNPSSSSTDSKAEALDSIALSFCQILQSMLLSSLSNHRSIAQGEKDVSSCIAALSESPMGSVTAHVVLVALAGVLTWCEILPVEAAVVPMTDSSGGSNASEEHKVEVASRLGRNLLMAQFHDVLAPVLLSRTVFSGEKSMMSASQKAATVPPIMVGTATTLSWQSHWRTCLVLFSWIASIAGPEGLIASQSTGSLLLASALAGSLDTALDDSDKVVITTMFMPSPAMALLIGATLRNEWSYKDLLADRLQIMMPMLPGMVISLLSHPSNPESTITRKSVVVLSHVLSAVGGSFHRVFGGIVHTTGRQTVKTRGEGSSDAIKAAKTYVPQLLIISMILENHIALRSACKKMNTGSGGIQVLRAPSTESADLVNKKAEAGSWVNVATTSTEDLVGDIVLSVPAGDGDLDPQDLVSFLQSCQKSTISTACGLLSNAFSLGGSGAAIPLLKSIISTLHDSRAYSAAGDRGSEKESLKEQGAGEVRGVGDGSNDDKEFSDLSAIAQDVLCRVVSLVLLKSLQREQKWDVWSYELSSAVAKMCVLVEERELLVNPCALSSNGEQVLSDDQVVLICALLDILCYGRDVSGWCQLVLPSINSKTGQKGSEMTANSKLLLPVLRSCLSILLHCVKLTPSSTKIQVSELDDGGQEDQKIETLIDRLLTELDRTLTAAIVGLAFSSAREVALDAIAALRKAIHKHEEADDTASVTRCKALLVKVVEELRVRYESERRLRDNALFDAYEDDGKSSSAKDAAHGSSVVERLILGDVGLAGFGSHSEEVTFAKGSEEQSGGRGSDDFVLFHEPSSDEPKSAGKLGFASLQGLGAALEEWKMTIDPDSDTDTSFSKAISILSSFLDSWDAAEAQAGKETELVRLFDSKMQLDTIEPKVTSEVGQLPILGSGTAADAMSTFFEFAADEKTRLKEIAGRFLPGHRQSKVAFADRFGWARYTEFASPTIFKYWERTVPDGNRDIRSRLPTLPCSPQFRRYLPKYLDHGSERAEVTAEAETGLPDNDFESPHRTSMAPLEIDALTKTLLETTHLEIVDITKKEIEDEGEPEALQSSATALIDEEDTGLFAEEDNDEEVDPSDRDQHSSDQHSSDMKGQRGDADSVSEDLDVMSHGEDSAEFAVSDFAGKSNPSVATSSFSTPPDNSTSSLSLMHSAAAGMIQQHVPNCMHVKAEGNRQCTVLLTESHLILEYDGNADGFFEGEMLAQQEEADRQKRILEDVGPSHADDPEVQQQQRDEKRNREMAILRPKSIRWNLSEVSHVYLRRYRLRDSALELFVIPTGGTSYGGFGLFSPSSSLFLDFGPGHEGKVRRDEAAFAIMRRSPQQAIKQWPDRSGQFLQEQIGRLTMGWVEGRITNFDYLLHLNILSGRSYNDICQYPVFPWILSNYHSDEIPDLTDRKNFRDLSKPVGALNPERLKDFIERFTTFADPSIPPFMYGSHYSTSAGVVLHFLVRLHPFAGLHRQLQGGHFDVADRLFSSVPRTWSMCTGTSAAEVKELTPEWYCNPAFLRNNNDFKLGTSQDGEKMGDVVLPPWAKGSPEKFIDVMRAALESDVCSEMLSDWIDLIFGRKQQGPEAIEANNVFFYLTYYGTVDVASIEDEALRQATELQIAHFGQCPMQLFRRPHVRRLPRNYFRLSLYPLLSTYNQRQQQASIEDETDKGAAKSKGSDRARLHSVFGDLLFLPFLSAPMSHWVHSNAPPPGPHSPLIALRFAGTDRCLAVDAKGIFHYFRWAWRADEVPQDTEQGESFFDKGCFVAQRELPRFRTVPRLMYTPRSDKPVAVAISKTLFANRSVLLVLSDGDGCGGFGMQLVDPAKGDIKGEVLVPQVHSAQITCIATDPIGTAAGHGGVGGELTLLGSADGNASLWRFMSSHFLPLRPRVRLQGHEGKRILAAALCSPIHIAATLSAEKCCLYSTGNGAMTRSFGPPSNPIEFMTSENERQITRFADTPALAVSVQGYVVTVCETIITSGTDADRTVITLHLFTIEGASLGSKPLESWRGLPHKMHCTPDGTTLMVCCGRGVTFHRLSAFQPLEFLDEFQVTESDDFSGTAYSAWDIDMGPALNRPIVAAAACTDGALRLHALPGISAWSERHKKAGLSIGNPFATPARKIKSAVREGLGLSNLSRVGRDLQREVVSEVKERGVFGMFRKNSSSK